MIMTIAITNKLAIIRYHEEFKDSFRVINYEWIEKYFEVTELDKQAFENPEKAILDKGGYIYLALYDNTIIGSIALERISNKQFALTRMGVQASFQGMKVGQSLMKTAIDKCKELELDSVILYTNQVLINALNLYFKNGFKFVALDYVPYKRATIKMELKLLPFG
jgi:N-acetylglutamate synthase-like GNAT family acetyltransferase